MSCPHHGPEDQIELLDPYTFGRTQTCFGCGPHNAHGLKMRFERDGEVVRSRLNLPAGYDGPPGILHGGLQAMVSDEVAGWTLVGLRGRIGLTTSLQIRYIGSLRLNQEILVEGKISSETPEFATIQVNLSQNGRVGAMARVTFALVSVEKLEEKLEGPCPDGWARFFTHEDGSPVETSLEDANEPS